MTNSALLQPVCGWAEWSADGESGEEPQMARSNVAYRIEVLGYIWSGHRSTYTYNSQTAPKDAHAVKAMAGDFDSIADYAVVEVRRGGDWSHEWTKRKTVKQWDDMGSFDEFHASEAA